MMEALQKEFSFATLKETVSQNLKPVIGYSLLFIFLALSIGALPILGLDSSYFFYIKTGMLLGFLWMGKWFTSTLNSRLYFLVQDSFDGRLLFTLFLSFSIFAGLSILYLFAEPSLLYLALGNTCAFLLPFLMVHAWNYYTCIPQSKFPVWYIPDGEIDTRATIFLNSITLKIKVTQKYFDPEEMEFVITEPGRMPLGKVFYHFITRQNAKADMTIDCVDENKHPFGWEFYVENLNGLFKRHLNPEASLIDNKVEENTVITAKRVKQMKEQVTPEWPE